MVFNRHDIYTSSGSVMLYNSWTPYVSKFDTSSFYNWEQDNLPLYDLEERTYEMWEQGGFPTSSIPGFALTVSADTPTATLQANSTIFTSVSSCIAAIPKVVRFPVLIEVCNFGNMGPLELHNFRIEEGGSIEIINRNYGRIYNASAGIQGKIEAANITHNQSHSLISTFSDQNLSATFCSGLNSEGLMGGMRTSGIHIATPVFTAANPTVFNAGEGEARASAVHSFLYIDQILRKSPLSVSLYEEDTWGKDSQDYFHSRPYEKRALAIGSNDNSMGVADVSATDVYDSGLLVRSAGEVLDKVSGGMYMNNCSKISVQNCDGPIYIRNFIVDGSSQAANSGQEVGIHIVNSDVVLENCGAVRCRDAGFKFNNSKVMLSRSAFAYRAYDLSSATGRMPEKGVGFHAINSDVSISALLGPTSLTQWKYGNGGDWDASGDDIVICASRNYVGMKLDNSRLTGGFQRSFPGQDESGGTLALELNTGYGLQVNNSHIDLKGLIDVYENEEGIKLNNSYMRYEQLCVGRNNGKGLASNNSTILWDSNVEGFEQDARRQVDFSGNGQHINLENQSTFTFKKRNHIPELYGNTFIVSAVGREVGLPHPALPAISVSHNSQADFLNLKFLTRAPTHMLSNMPQYGLGAVVDKNSDVDFYGTKEGATFILGPDSYARQQYVAGVCADNNSTVGFHGPTFIGRFGVDVLANNNSTINITPPRIGNSFLADSSSFDLSAALNQTSVELHSTRACLVANKNSTINLENLGSFDNYWTRSAQGVTALAAGTDYQQTYGAESDGLSATIGYGSLQFFPNPQNSQAITHAKTDSLIQLNIDGRAEGTPIFSFQTNGNQFLISDNWFTNTLPGAGWIPSMAKASYGGVCVRAVEDSVVNVNNVCFPVGTNDSPLDGPYYDVSATPCDRLMIWNIADTSRLNASYCSVSGMYPADVGYHGPSAVWASALNVDAGPPVVGTGEMPASGAPSSTPDTGVLSVLDAFGAGSSVWAITSGTTINMPFKRIALGGWTGGGGGTLDPSFAADAGIAVSGGSGDTFGRVSPGIFGAGIQTYKNQGVFRLYFSPKSEVKLLQNDMSGWLYGSYTAAAGRTFSGVVGPAYQVFAQGYNMSANLSAVIPTGYYNASSFYPNLLKLSIDSQGCRVFDKLWTSGFYYCSEFVEDNPTQCMLDESAANTFANAKNASLGMSGKPRKVTLYRARSDSAANQGAEAYEGDVLATQGFKSANIFDLKRDN